MAKESLVEELAEKLGKNLIIDEAGTISEAVLPASCFVSYVDCNPPHETKVQTLKPGQTFLYGDWNGTKCVRKKFVC